jgi:hypothetical protein
VWTPEKIESRSATLDLNSSGQGLAAVRQVICDDVVVCNAANHIDWSIHPVEFEMCEACLCAGCEPGGRVAIRRAEDRVLIMPDFAAMSESDCALIEHGLPRWMEKRGALSLSSSDWEAFQTACGGAPFMDAIAPASTTELLRLYHFQAPRAFLRDYLSPSLAKWNLILCTKGQDSSNDLVHLRRLFSDPLIFEGHEFCTPFRLF